jgi:hypothetical protein
MELVVDWRDRVSRDRLLAHNAAVDQMSLRR